MTRESSTSEEGRGESEWPRCPACHATLSRRPIHDCDEAILVVGYVCPNNHDLREWGIAYDKSELLDEPHRVDNPMHPT